MISLSHWGLLDIEAIAPSFDGPAYADRVGGKLTFRDWEHWKKEDQDKYSGEFMKRAPKTVIFKFMLGIQEAGIAEAGITDDLQDRISKRFSREIQSGDRS